MAFFFDSDFFNKPIFMLPMINDGAISTNGSLTCFTKQLDDLLLVLASCDIVSSQQCSGDLGWISIPPCSPARDVLLTDIVYATRYKTDTETFHIHYIDFEQHLHCHSFRKESSSQRAGHLSAPLLLGDC
jgi:hypothetical protein